MKNQFLKLAFLLLIAYSCKKESENSFTYSSDGVFVVNEGSFMSGNASVSYFHHDLGYSIENVYEAFNNNLPLGDVAQSMNIYNGKGYIVVNNSQKVEVVDINNFKSIHTISGFSGPRYFLGVNQEKGYVTDWSANEIKVINLNDYSVSTTIPCGAGPEKMVIMGKTVFVCNVGGFGDDSTITVIDASTNSVIKTINVAVDPNSLQIDVNGKLWVLCQGSLGPDYTPSTADDIAGKLIQIDPVNYSILKEFDFAQDGHPIKLAINKEGTILYFLGGNSAFTGKVYKMSITDTVLPSSAVIDRDFYALGYDPVNSTIYCGLPNFALNTYVLQYDLSGNIIDSAKAGIAPNSFVFNY